MGFNNRKAHLKFTGSKLLMALSSLIFFFGATPTFASSHDELVAFFSEWRTFERPPMRNGAPDYTAATFAARHRDFLNYRNRLEALDTSNWTISEKVDWHIVRAEMNGFDFNYRILKPWVRDPAFYNSIWANKSDVPAHEGPTHHALTELWTYEFPLSVDEENRLTNDLAIIPPLMLQARENLTGNARELWIAGIRDIRQQYSLLNSLQNQLGNNAGDSLSHAISTALVSTSEFINWLEREAPSKTGPSGIGRENYTWYQQNVHLVPLTWEDEVRLLKRELDRAWSSLKLEEHRNRNLPSLHSAESPEAFDLLADKSADRLISFLREQDIVTVADYFEPALRAHLGEFIPAKVRNFFEIGAHFNPTPLYSHFYHWFELARMDEEPNPNPIRRNALLYNIFDSRSEGTATAVEEMFMHAGLYDDTPRVREIVWIMIAQRAARGLGSLYAHANELTMKEAGQIHMNYTPRSWMKTEEKLLMFEQHLYLRQPGYGTSYITGKYLLERTLAEYGKVREDKDQNFSLKAFFDELNAIGNIPIALVRWQMTGQADDIKMIYKDAD